MIETLLALAVTTTVDVSSQTIDVTLDPATHALRATSTLHLSGSGTLPIHLNEHITIDAVQVNGADAPVPPLHSIPGGAQANVPVPEGAQTLTLTYHALFEQDAAAGERLGEIHNFAVNAHVGEDGIFLGDGAAWHPHPLDDPGNRLLHIIDVNITPLEGWVLIAAGNPLDDNIDEPCWHWRTPRPVDGTALVGNQHQIHSLVHDTAEGPVEIVMHATEAHGRLAPMILNAAASYLDIYVPRLGPYPYQRFTVVENFFSSGFAFPGFTLISERVVGMGPLVTRPGLLDHELVHSWWGNGVYLSTDDGNWCESLTSYCANYFRRIVDDGEDAGREYRMGTLMKLSADPTGLDDGALGDFGSANPEGGGPTRFVGYDKGAFLFAMLENLCPETDGVIDRTPIWNGLRRFASAHMGQRAGWAELQTALEAELGVELDPFFTRWLRDHPVPITPSVFEPETMDRLVAHYEPFVKDMLDMDGGKDELGIWVDIDPQFRAYRVLPPSQIVPLVGSTLGVGGTNIISAEAHDVIGVFKQMYPSSDDGENLLLIGPEAINEHQDLIARSGDPIIVTATSFTIDDITYDQPGHTVLHTMQHADQPGRFITVFHANGDDGWGKLRVIAHYAHDTTVIWLDGADIQRRTHEPDRRIRPRK